MASLRSSILRQTSALRPLRSLRVRQPIASSSRSLSVPPLYRHSLPLSSTPISSSVSRRWNHTSSSGGSAPENPQIEAPSGDGEGSKQKIGQIEPRLQMTFTCTANDCGHRSTHEFSKRAYTKGLVLVQCPECKSRHLIADHIGWFKESLEGGKLKTVEDLLRAKGEKIRKGRVNMEGDIEYEGDD
ncbi:hypothetical protein I302_107657 [Kwoniella bestiolae CBS 10118]|uniref:DNL-type domain-containing protein n=1 Tax=Kwoniella bestiolae CBS 10118 TaxID=1296100 RepID=A0A1B9FXY2_9TREE|nr:hypothetical protein I302_06604 [Kwoniella bestiolae CBS 10118]OCF23621.1 hypothetical protein I302_06604 [Kwoniella bestiolae CBS 10118]